MFLPQLMSINQILLALYICPFLSLTNKPCYLLGFIEPPQLHIVLEGLWTSLAGLTGSFSLCSLGLQAFFFGIFPGLNGQFTLPALQLPALICSGSHLGMIWPISAFPACPALTHLLFPLTFTHYYKVAKGGFWVFWGFIRLTTEHTLKRETSRGFENVRTELDISGNGQYKNHSLIINYDVLSEK